MLDQSHTPHCRLTSLVQSDDWPTKNEVAGWLAGWPNKLKLGKQSSSKQPIGGLYIPPPPAAGVEGIGG